jgi:ATP-dependent 26S proteasome regulatory subunit
MAQTVSKSHPKKEKTPMQLNHEEFARDSEEDFASRLQILSNSGAGVIHVRTSEVMRAVTVARRVILSGGDVYHEWDIHRGMREFTIDNLNDYQKSGDSNNDVNAQLAAPLAATSDPAVMGSTAVHYYVYLNIHHWLQAPLPTHHILQAAAALPATNIRIILITPDVPLPDILAENTIMLRLFTPGHAELMASLETILSGLPDDVVEELDEEDKDRICFNGAGMSKDAFDTYASLAIIDSADKHENGDNGQVTVDEIVTGLNVGKTEVVNKNDILELYPVEDMSNVGGMDNLKAWVRRRRDCYSDEAIAFGIEPPKGMVFVGPPGCLAGNTEVIYRRGKRNSGRGIDIRMLYHKFNGLTVPDAGRGFATPWRDLTVPTYLHSLMPDGTVAYNRIISVIEAGMKEVVTVATEDGDELTLTPTHPVANRYGTFVPAGELQPGDEVTLRGSMRPVNAGGKKLDARPPRNIVNCKYHKYGSFKEVDYYSYRRVPMARLVIEAHMNGMEVDEFIHALKHNRSLSGSFKYLEPEYEVHHVDEDTLNDDLSNLMVYTKEEHARVHGATENFNVEYIRLSTVKSVEPAGEVMTYDIQMDMPANNFAANGFIVHNTGKSLAAKSVASELGVPLVRLDFGRIFNSLVGASEERVRMALRMVESMAPVVLFVDEIDKGLGGIGSGGDSGTSSRVLGTFLTWLQENKRPVFTMVTANNVKGLPPELLRRGRFDAIFSTGMPTHEEREEVTCIHLAKRGYDPEDMGVNGIKAIARASAGYVPAEIESAIKDGLIDAFAEGEDFCEDHVVVALRAMVPLSKAFNKEINAMTLWAHENATPAGLVADHSDAPASPNNVRTIRKGPVRKAPPKKDK